MIEGIKHRILAYLFRAHHAEGSCSAAVRKFFYDFQDYANLVIWKVGILCVLHHVNTFSWFCCCNRFASSVQVSP